MSRRQIWVAMSVALLLVLGSLLTEGGLRRFWRLRQDRDTLTQRNAALVKENGRLRREVEALRDDPAAIERAAREELGLVRPGEVVISLEEP